MAIVVGSEHHRALRKVQVKTEESLGALLARTCPIDGTPVNTRTGKCEVCGRQLVAPIASEPAIKKSQHSADQASKQAQFWARRLARQRQELAAERLTQRQQDEAKHTSAEQPTRAQVAARFLGRGGNFIPM